MNPDQNKNPEFSKHSKNSPQNRKHPHTTLNSCFFKHSNEIPKYPQRSTNKTKNQSFQNVQKILPKIEQVRKPPMHYDFSKHLKQFQEIPPQKSPNKTNFSEFSKHAKDSPKISKSPTKTPKNINPAFPKNQKKNKHIPQHPPSKQKS